MGSALFHGRQRLLGSRRSRSQRARLSLTNARHPRSRRLLRAKNAGRRQRRSHAADPLGLDHRKAPRRRTPRRWMGRLHVPPAHPLHQPRQHSRNGNRARSPLVARTNFRNTLQTLSRRSQRARPTNQIRKCCRRIFLDELRRKIEFRSIRSKRPLAHSLNGSRSYKLKAHSKRQNNRNPAHTKAAPRLLPLPRRQRRRTDLRQPTRRHNPHLPQTRRPAKNHLRPLRKKSLPTLRLATQTHLAQPPHHLARRKLRQKNVGAQHAAPHVRKIDPTQGGSAFVLPFPISIFRFPISASLHPQLIQPLLIETPLPIKPNLTPLPLTLRIHHPILRNRHHRQHFIHQISRQQHRERIVLIPHIRPNIRRGIVDVKRHHLYVAAILHLLIKLLQIRMLRLAWPAPTRPHVDQHRLALQIHQLPRLALQIRQAPVRQILFGLLPSRVLGNLRVRHSCQPRLPAVIASAQFLPQSRITLLHFIYITRRRLVTTGPRIDRRSIHEHRVELVPVHFRPLRLYLPDGLFPSLFVIQGLHFLHRRLCHLRLSRLPCRVNQEICAQYHERCVLFLQTLNDFFWIPVRHRISAVLFRCRSAFFNQRRYFFHPHVTVKISLGDIALRRRHRKPGDVALQCRTQSLSDFNEFSRRYLIFAAGVFPLDSQRLFQLVQLPYCSDFAPHRFRVRRIFLHSLFGALVHGAVELILLCRRRVWFGVRMFLCPTFVDDFLRAPALRILADDQVTDLPLRTLVIRILESLLHRDQPMQIVGSNRSTELSNLLIDAPAQSILFLRWRRNEIERPNRAPRVQPRHVAFALKPASHLCRIFRCQLGRRQVPHRDSLPSRQRARTRLSIRNQLRLPFVSVPELPPAVDPLQLEMNQRHDWRVGRDLFQPLQRFSRSRVHQRYRV